MEFVIWITSGITHTALSFGAVWFYFRQQSREEARTTKQHEHEERTNEVTELAQLHRLLVEALCSISDLQKANRVCREEGEQMRNEIRDLKGQVAMLQTQSKEAGAADRPPKPA